MANTWGMIGGAAQGILQGEEDNRQRALYNFQMQQLQRQKKQQDAEDAAAVELQQGIQRDQAPQADLSGKGMTAGSLDQGDWPTVKPPDVPPHEVLRRQAQIYAKSGVPSMALKASQLHAAADQQEMAQYTLQDRKYENDMNNVLRRADTMTPLELGNALAAIKTGDRTSFNANIVTDSDTGKHHIVVYNPVLGTEARVSLEDEPAKAKAQLVQLAQMSMSPASRQAELKLLQGNAEAAAKLKIADADALKAKTSADEYGQKLLHGYWEAEVKGMKAKAGESEAHEAYFKAYADELKAKAADFEAKLPAHQKMYLDTLKALALSADKAAMEDPKLRPAAQARQMNLFQYYRDIGLPGAPDPYQAAGIPSPQSAADDMKQQKVKGKGIEAALKIKADMYGEPYADKVRIQFHGGAGDTLQGLSKADAANMRAMDASGAGFKMEVPASGKSQGIRRVTPEGDPLPPSGSPAAASADGTLKNVGKMELVAMASNKGPLQQAAKEELQRRSAEPPEQPAPVVAPRMIPPPGIRR